MAYGPNFMVHLVLKVDELIERSQRVRLPGGFKLIRGALPSYLPGVDGSPSLTKSQRARDNKRLADPALRAQ